MKRYDYTSAIMTDIENWIKNDNGATFNPEDYKETPGGFYAASDAMTDDLFDLLFEHSEISGYPDGYTDDETKLESYLAGNERDLQNAIYAQGIEPPKTLKEKDAAIRMSFFYDACAFVALGYLERWCDELDD